MSEEPAIVFEWGGEKPLAKETPRPAPATEFIPPWFKNLPSKFNSARTVKLCSSFGDAMRMGYIVPLPYDFEYSVNSGEITVNSENPADDVKVYGNAKPEQNRNSSFKPPDIRIDLPWNIHTPEGYSTLITYPMNRPDSGVKSYTLFVDTDTHDVTIPIPASLTQNEKTIPAGTPFVQVIPIHREGLLPNAVTTSESENPDLWEFWEVTHQQSLSVPGFYRRFCWVPKDPSGITDCTDVDIDLEGMKEEVTSSKALPDEYPFDEDPPHQPEVICEDQYSGIMPTPSSLDEEIPRWIKNPETLPSSDAGDAKVAEWARNAMDLGWVMPAISDVTLRKDGDKFEYGSEIEEPLLRGKSGNTKVVTTHSPNQVGAHFPLDDFHIVKISSTWFTCTPPGYSTLIREPINHRQSELRSYAGFTDSDRCVVDGNIIGLFTESQGEYLFPKGMPTVCEVPIHRDAILKNAFIAP